MQGNVPGELIPIVLFVMGGLTAIGYPIARALARRIEHKPLAPPISRDMEERIARMEHTLDAMALEIERISEGQRFTTKLLAEQQTNKLGAGGAEGRR
jgi:hypothetical protein